MPAALGRSLTTYKSWCADSPPLRQPTYYVLATSKPTVSHLLSSPCFSSRSAGQGFLPLKWRVAWFLVSFLIVLASFTVLILLPGAGPVLQQKTTTTTTTATAIFVPSAHCSHLSTNVSADIYADRAVPHHSDRRLSPQGS